MPMLLKEKIPSLFHLLCPELIKLELPKEIIADCNNCVLCRSPHSPYINTKCCSYHPYLSNFICGAILSEDGQYQGQEKILEKISKRLGVTPYGIIPPLSYLTEKQVLDSPDFWLKPQYLLEKQLCPFYDGSSCSIWSYRDHLCSTYFCSSIGGLSGKKFWMTVNEYLKLMQTVLERYSMISVGWLAHLIIPEPLSSKEIFWEDKNGVVFEDNYKKLWGDWIGREADFYKSCYKIISSTDENTFKQLSGRNGETLLSKIVEAHKILTDNILPDFLILRTDLIYKELDNGRLLIRADDTSVEIPQLLFTLVKAFNGERTTKEVYNLGYDVLYIMNELVDELFSKGILVKYENE